MDIFSSRSFAERGIFNVKQVQQIYEAFCQADPFANSLGIFQLLIVECWFRCLIDGKSL